MQMWVCWLKCFFPGSFHCHFKINTENTKNQRVFLASIALFLLLLNIFYIFENYVYTLGLFCLHMYTHAYVLKYIYTHACTHMYVRAYISHMYTCVYLCMEKSIISVYMEKRSREWLCGSVCVYVSTKNRITNEKDNCTYSLKHVCALSQKWKAGLYWHNS